MLQRTAWIGALALLAACTHPDPTTPDNNKPASGGQSLLGSGGSLGSTGGTGGTFSSGGSDSSRGGTLTTTGGSAQSGGHSSGGNVAGMSAATGGASGASGASGAAGSSAAGSSGGGTGPQGDPPGVVAAPFKFPQNFRSANCTYPSLVRSTFASQAYTRWKTELVTSDGAGGFRRVRRPGNESDTTVSEGIGYGMIFAVVMDDQSLFDDLWKYSQQYLNQNGLMNWEVSADAKVIGQGAATDADEDIAWALGLADKKWGGKGSLSDTYLNLAKQQIDKIWNHEVHHDGGELLLAGDSWWPTVVYNPSYFAPNEYRLFAKISGNSNWNRVIDKGYEMFGKMLTSGNGNADNGLVPAWTDGNGTPTAAFAGAPTHYQYDSARTPFRIGLDYCDFGEPRAKAYLSKTSNFFSKLGAANIVDGYDLNGNARAENSSAQSALFVGAPGVGAMSDPQYQSFVNDTYGLLIGKDMLPPSYYFNLSWQVFALMMMSGNLFDYSLH